MAVKVAHSDQQTIKHSASHLTVFSERRTKMPVMKKPDGWYWGSKGPFTTKQKAIQVGQAAHASGFKGEIMTEEILEDEELFITQIDAEGNITKIPVV